MVIRSFTDFEVYQRSYRAMKICKVEIVEKLPANEKFGLVDQINRACMAIPRLIAEGYGKKHQKRGFHKYLADALAESNEMVVSLSQVLEFYGQFVDIIICKRLIKTYDVIGKELYRLHQNWRSFDLEVKNEK